MEEQYYWKCPECGEVQKITSAFFLADCGSNERCLKCFKRVHCHHPATPFEIKKGEIIAFKKE